MLEAGNYTATVKIRADFLDACATGRAAAVSAYLARFPDAVGWQDPETGQLPLGFAAARDDAKLVALLLENGAQPQTRDKNGDTAFDAAAKFNSGAASALLQEHVAGETKKMVAALGDEMAQGLGARVSVGKPPKFRRQP